MVAITLSQLAMYNGVEKEETWIAYRGEIYDVTESRKWPNGLHFGHWAGQDLTDELRDAPHGEEVFKRYPKIGVIIS